MYIDAQDKIDGNFDRSYALDHANRLSQALTGQEARDFVTQTNSGQANGPYKQVYTRNVWGEQTIQTGRYWTSSVNLSAIWKQGQHDGWQYSNSGQIINDGDATYSYDATGRNANVLSPDSSTWQWFDGNGESVKKHTSVSFGLFGSMSEMSCARVSMSF